MWIKRDITSLLENDKGSYIQIVIGPRQCGKSSLLAQISGSTFYEITFDDLQNRQLADSDPALFLSQHPPPLLIDEVQYAPNIFPELKRLVDILKRQALDKKQPNIQVMFRLTGSNQITMDKHVKESLVGRASFYYLNTLSVHEIIRAYPETSLQNILFMGGWPELYTNPALTPVKYLNDYVRSYIEKDVVLSAGITKQKEFHTVLGMLAARTGNLLNYSSIAKDSGVKSVTVKEWTSILERSQICYLLHPCEPNLNKRLIKSPKLYFIDTGVAIRLQGWTEIIPALKSPQAGAIFETLVLSEIIKYKENHGKLWKISLWRTKDGEEIDFIIENGRGDILAIDAKMGIHSVKPQPIPPKFSQTFSTVKELVLVTLGGKKQRLSKQCLQIPIKELHTLLASF